jgi:photosystem II stability/assembly factor-like uncharacterized protein
LSHRHGPRFAAALLILFCGSAQAEFKDVLDTPAMMSPLAKSSPLQAITRAGSRLVAVGGRGHILISDDLGANWTQVPVPVSSDLTAVAFPDAEHGWAVGHDGVVLATEDGGAHWRKQLDGKQAGQLMVEAADNNETRGYEADGADKPFLDVWFADRLNGYVVGAFNLIFKTQDGGRSWQPLFGRTANPQRLHLYAIQPVGDQLFIAGEGGLLLKSKIGADDFQAVKLPYDGSLFGLRSDGRSLVVFGLRGNLFRSADLGASWNKVETNERSAFVGSTFDPGGRMVVVAQGGVLLSSDDGFQTFQAERAKQPMPLTGVAEVGDKMVLVGIRGVVTQ